jgi:hypothetical protein
MLAATASTITPTRTIVESGELCVALSGRVDPGPVPLGPLPLGPLPLGPAPGPGDVTVRTSVKTGFPLGPVTIWPQT